MSVLRTVLLAAPLLFLASQGYAQADEGRGGEHTNGAVNVRITPNLTTVKTAGNWQVSFSPQTRSMAPKGSIKVRFAKGFGPTPLTQDHVTAHTSRPDVTASITSINNLDPDVPWKWERNAWTVTVQLGGGSLTTADTLHVHFGEQRPLFAPRSAFTEEIYLAYDLEGNGVYTDFLPRPTVQILPGPPAQIAGLIPSTITAGVPFLLKIIAYDAYHNLAPDFTGPIALTSTDPLADLPAVLLSQADSGHTAVNVTFHSPGVHRISLHAVAQPPAPPWQVETNPGKVFEETPPYQLFWGDLHSHSAISKDGHGRQTFQKARDVAALDFYALTDHTAADPPFVEGRSASITAAEWETIKQETARYNQPGRFTTIPGYEFSTRAPYGHHNVFFNVPDDRIAEVPLFREDLFPDIRDLWDLANNLPAGIKMTAIPHHTGIIFNIPDMTGPLTHFGAPYAHTGYRRLIEIYSQHGHSEFYAPEHDLSYESVKPGRISANGPHYAQDAWAAEEYLGVIASSDDHSGRPGLPFNGLAAIYADALTRSALFDGLQSRHTYGTTGPRILIEFRIEGQPMGTQQVLPTGHVPEIEVEVHGTDDLALVEVLRTDLPATAYEQGHPHFTPVFRQMPLTRSFTARFTDSTFTDTALYYVRVRQKNKQYRTTTEAYHEVWAWSSPIWLTDDPSFFARNQPLEPPEGPRILPNYPNPFHDHTTANYFIPQRGWIRIGLYNLLGQRVRLLEQGRREEGWHTLEIEAHDLAPGLYFVRLKTNQAQIIRKVILLR